MSVEKYCYVILLGDFIYDYEFIKIDNQSLLNFINDNRQVLQHNDCNIHEIVDFADAYNSEMLDDNMILCFVPENHDLDNYIKANLVNFLC